MKMSGENGWRRGKLQGLSEGEVGGKTLWLVGREGGKGLIVYSPLNDGDQRPGYNSSNYTLEIAVIVQ